jgi:hypothetical protein
MEVLDNYNSLDIELKKTKKALSSFLTVYSILNGEIKTKFLKTTNMWELKNM